MRRDGGVEGDECGGHRRQDLNGWTAHLGMRRRLIGTPIRMTTMGGLPLIEGAAVVWHLVSDAVACDECAAEGKQRAAECQQADEQANHDALAHDARWLVDRAIEIARHGLYC